MASSRRVGGAALARAVQDHLVFGDAQRHVLADATQLAFESLVSERIEPPAAIADHVMVVAVAVPHRLVAHDALADLDPAHQLGLLKLLENPVHARPRHRSVLALEGGADLDGRQGAALLAEQSDHRASRTATAEPGGGQTLARSLSPILDAAHRIHRRTPANGRELTAKAST